MPALRSISSLFLVPGLSERVSAHRVKSALRAILFGATHVLKLEGELGSIARDKQADFWLLRRHL
jgi:imidazolonepropionase-like amidohydrolase